MNPFQSILGKAASLVASALLSVGLIQAPAPAVNLGTAVPSTPALIDTYLASGITDSATSMTLANGTTRDGTSLSGFMCFTIDANTPTVEYVCGTASGTAVSAMTRGVNLTNPNATTSYAYPHRRLASVQTTDYPTIQFIARKLNGTDSLDAPLLYSSASSTFISSAAQLASKAYVDSVAVAGAPDAAVGTKGLVDLPTKAQMAAGTATGTTSAYYALPAMYANQTSSATTTIPVTKSNGKLSQTFIDFTEAMTFAATTTHASATQFNATATFAVIPQLPSSSPSGVNDAVRKDYVDGLLATTEYASSSVSTGALDGTVDWSTSTLSITTSKTKKIALYFIGKARSSGATNESCEVRFNINASTTIITTNMAFETDSSNVAFTYPMGGAWVSEFAAGSYTFRPRIVESGAGTCTVTGIFSAVAFPS